MLLNILKAKARESHIKLWAIGYLLVVITGGIIIAIFFREAPYSTGQIAVAIAMPVMVVLTVVRLIQYLQNLQTRKVRKKREAVREGGAIEGWMAMLSGIFLLIFFSSLFFALTLSISSWVYRFIGLEWATRTAWHNIAVPSFWVAGSSLVCVSALLAVVIVKPYWHNMLLIAKKRVVLWHGSTREIHINGIRVPLHH